MSSISYSFGVNLKSQIPNFEFCYFFSFKVTTVVFVQSYYLYGLLIDHEKSGPNSNILRIGRHILNLKVVQQTTISSYLLSSKVLCPHLLLIYACSTCHCRHAAVVSCFALHSPLFLTVRYVTIRAISKQIIFTIQK